MWKERILRSIKKLITSKGYWAYCIATFIGWMAWWHFADKGETAITGIVTLFLMFCAYIEGLNEGEKNI